LSGNRRPIKGQKSANNRTQNGPKKKKVKEKKVVRDTEQKKTKVLSEWTGKMTFKGKSQEARRSRGERGTQPTNGQSKGQRQVR